MYCRRRTRVRLARAPTDVPDGAANAIDFDERNLSVAIKGRARAELARLTLSQKLDGFSFTRSHIIDTTMKSHPYDGPFERIQAEKGDL